MSKWKQRIKGNPFLYFPIKKYHWARLKASNVLFEIERMLRHAGIGKKKYNAIKAFKNKHLGERCFIVATGPSITKEDLEKIQDEYTFSMNSMCLLADKNEWRPTYYGVQDLEVFKKLKDVILRSKIETVFLAQYLKKQFDVPKEWVGYPQNSAYHAYDCYFRKKYYAKFSSDCSDVVYDGYSITYALIQIAAYMGFKKIYLLGCDCNYDPDPKRRHFIEHGVDDPTYMEAGKRMICAYQQAKKAGEKQGFEIFNATRGGKLEVFPRVDLDQLLM